MASGQAQENAAWPSGSATGSGGSGANVANIGTGAGSDLIGGLLSAYTFGILGGYDPVQAPQLQGLPGPAPIPQQSLPPQLGSNMAEPMVTLPVRTVNDLANAVPGMTPMPTASPIDAKLDAVHQQNLDWIEMERQKALAQRSGGATVPIPAPQAPPQAEPPPDKRDPRDMNPVLEQLMQQQNPQHVVTPAPQALVFGQQQAGQLDPQMATPHDFEVGDDQQDALASTSGARPPRTAPSTTPTSGRAAWPGGPTAGPPIVPLPGSPTTPTATVFPPGASTGYKIVKSMQLASDILTGGGRLPLQEPETAEERAARLKGQLEAIGTVSKVIADGNTRYNAAGGAGNPNAERIVGVYMDKIGQYLNVGPGDPEYDAINEQIRSPGSAYYGMEPVEVMKEGVPEVNAALKSQRPEDFAKIPEGIRKKSLELAVDKFTGDGTVRDVITTKERLQRAGKLSANPTPGEMQTAFSDPDNGVSQQRTSDGSSYNPGTHFWQTLDDSDEMKGAVGAVTDKGAEKREGKELDLEYAGSIEAKKEAAKVPYRSANVQTYYQYDERDNVIPGSGIPVNEANPAEVRKAQAQNYRPLDKRLSGSRKEVGLEGNIGDPKKEAAARENIANIKGRISKLSYLSKRLEDIGKGAVGPLSWVGQNIGGPISALAPEVGGSFVRALTGADLADIQHFREIASSVVADSIPVLVGEEGARKTDTERALADKAANLTRFGASEVQAAESLDTLMQLEIVARDREMFKAGMRWDNDLDTVEGRQAEMRELRDLGFDAKLAGRTIRWQSMLRGQLSRGELYTREESDRIKATLRGQR